ncbi:MAG: HesA/MoeB/ThiF family protein [Candidatus Thermoplasmatota archaeon]|nr:HesA/MoeB/ThiF family protein [Candidatus Thermoplasmatota archaeon]
MWAKWRVAILDIERFKGQIVLPDISVEGQKKIGSSTVAVVGLGGTGSMASELFARMGVGKLILFDGDRVSLSNIHRQILYSENDVGKFKAEAAAEHLSKETSVTKIISRNIRISDKNVGELLSCDIVFDGTDNFPSRHVIDLFSIRSGIPWVMCSAVEYYGQAKAILPGITSCLSCMHFPTRDERFSCSDAGIFPPLVTAISSLAAGMAVSIMVGGKVSGDLFTLDMRTMELVRIRVDRNPECTVCGTHGMGNTVGSEKQYESGH